MGDYIGIKDRDAVDDPRGLVCGYQIWSRGTRLGGTT